MDKQIEELLTRGIVNMIPGKQELQKKLSSGEKLNVYLGVDPTATKIHIGHAVPLRKLQQLVDLGHNATFLIGDFTTLIGDTSDKDSERPILTKEEIQQNFQTYKQQAEKFLDFTQVSLKFNSEWLAKLSFEEIVKLAQNFSVGDFVSRELIRKRLDDGKKVRLDEMLYPIMQGYDSYYMNTDLQLGAADQTFNMQAGRTLQKKLRNKESYILVNDYLMGTDGRKMSKSWGNAIWVQDEPAEMYGKVMSLRDDLIEQYYLLATSLPQSEIVEKTNLAKTDPLQTKKQLAYQIVKEVHSATLAEKAQNYFESTFQQGELPSEPKLLKIDLDDNTIIDAVGIELGSRSEAKRLIEQGGVYKNLNKVEDFNENLSEGDILKIGKKKFVKIVAD